MLKILITGGSGFIAKSLHEVLLHEYNVVLVTRKELDLLDSVKVYDFFKKNKFDAVIHSATYDAAPVFSTKDPQKVLENNLRMFFNIARSKDHFGKMIYFGSGAEYSRENWIPNMKEDYFDKHVPSDQYGFSKYLMAKYAQLSNNIYNLRLFGVFGKYDDWRYRFIPNACCQAVYDMPITINQNAVFDFLYIDDLINIVQWFLNNKPSQNIYNVCSGKSYDFKTLAGKIINAANKSLDIKIKKEGLRIEYSGDNSLLKNEIKNLEFLSIDKSIEQLYKWYNSNKVLIDKEVLLKNIS
ncbi:MAG: NAD(P)-dependent oxidoreductase [Bacteroidetes bacterium]|nr:NAD(P)-dependent oxidoreductase [Bacteroidota bacterium]